jgi:valyl-tRNA synthetase
MNVAPARTLKDATVLTEQEGCVVKTTRTINRKGTIEMKQLDAINMRIASKPIIEALKEKGLIYQGEDGELHVIEHRKSTTNGADQS